MLSASSLYSLSWNLPAEFFRQKSFEQIWIWSQFSLPQWQEVQGQTGNWTCNKKHRLLGQQMPPTKVVITFLIPLKFALLGGPPSTKWLGIAS
jgi:hypothetical protein